MPEGSERHVYKSENAQHFQQVLCERDEDTWGLNDVKSHNQGHHEGFSEQLLMRKDMKMRSHGHLECIFEQICRRNDMKNRTLRKSFSNAWNGLTESIQRERNLKTHFAAMLVVYLGAFLLKLDLLRWALLFLASGFVVVTEVLNTAVEHLVDMVTTRRCEEARRVKDMAAAAVFMAAVFSVFIGIAVFIEPLLKLWHSR